MIKFLAKYSFFLAYIISYPVQVFSLGEKSGMFGLFIALSFFLLLLNTASYRSAAMFNKKSLFIIGIMAILPVSYLFSFIVNYDEYYSSILFKTIVLYLFLVMLLFSKNLLLFSSNLFPFYQKVYQPGALSSWMLFGIPMALMLFSALQNSLGTIPPGVVLDQKYYYGPFIRAGAGFVDPNALGLMVIITFAIFFDNISRYRLLLLFVSLSVFAIVTLTFSRTSQILYIVFFVFKIIKFQRKSDIIFFLIIFLLFLGWFVYEYNEIISFFFERYFNEEGVSSSYDRINQLKVFLDVISSINLKELFLGIGGQNAFQNLAGSAMHSAPLSIFIDSGILASIAVLIFFGISIKHSFKKPMDIFQIVAILTCFVLPYIPELFFLLCVYLVTENQNRIIFFCLKK